MVSHLFRAFYNAEWVLLDVWEGPRTWGKKLRKKVSCLFHPLEEWHHRHGGLLLHDPRCCLGNETDDETRYAIRRKP